MKRLYQRISNWVDKHSAEILTYMGIIVFVFIIPLILNNVMTDFRIKTNPNLTTADWLSFWGSYLGSAFSVMAACAAILVAYIQNEKQHRITREQFTEQQRLMMEQFSEQQRYSVQPFLSIEHIIPEHESELGKSVYVLDLEMLLEEVKAKEEGIFFDFPLSFHKPPPNPIEILDKLYSHRLVSSLTDKYASPVFGQFLIQSEVVCLKVSNLGCKALCDLNVNCLSHDFSLTTLCVEESVYLVIHFSPNHNVEQELMFNFQDIHKRNYQLPVRISRCELSLGDQVLCPNLLK